jgi:lantibiotic modifying enzyme
VSDLDAALGAARWLRRCRIETMDGVTWPSDPTKLASVGMDLFSGVPGVVLFHLELFDATGDSAWLDEARRGANALIARLPALQATGACGLYDGLAGVAFVLEETHRATGDGKYRDAAKQAIAMIHALAKKSITFAEWTGPSAGYDVVSGAAGIGLFLLWADEVIDDSESRTLALATGRRLVDVGTADRGGLKWPGKGSISYPNFAYGTAGVSFFLAELLRATGDRSCMAGALSGARYLESLANTDGSGFKVAHHEPGGEGVYEMGWCNGPAGTARLFRQLGIVTGRSKWGDMADACARSILASGAPEKRSPGYWNDVGQCSGSAGIGEFFIALQRESPKPEYAAMISRCSASLLSCAIADADGLKWLHAEDAAAPQVVVAQTGYMHGAAGIGTFFLHADGLAKGRVPAVTWPDSPWARPCVKRAKATKDMSDMNGRAPLGC